MEKVHTEGVNHADVIVIGAGVLGTFHAYHAACQGYKTLLLERNVLPSAASTRNFGMVMRTIVETGGAWAEYARLSQEIYRRLQYDHDITVAEAGSLYVASTALESQVLAEFAQRYGQEYSCTYLTASEALRRYTFLQQAYCQGVLHFPEDLVIEPQQMLRQFIAYLVAQNTIEYRPQTTVIAVEARGEGCIVRSADGKTFTADHVFVCSGVEYRTLFPASFIKSQLQICKLQMMRTVPQPGPLLPHALLSGLSIMRYPAFKTCPSYTRLAEQEVDQSVRDYGIHVLFKQAVDHSIIIGDSHIYTSCSEASGGEEYTDWQINEAIVRYGQWMLNLPTWKIQQLWNGYYMVNPHSDIYTETIDGVIHIVTGIAGKGMSTGPGFSYHHIKQTLVRRQALIDTA